MDRLYRRPTGIQRLAVVGGPLRPAGEVVVDGVIRRQTATRVLEVVGEVVLLLVLALQEAGGTQVRQLVVVDGGEVRALLVEGVEVGVRNEALVPGLAVGAAQLRLAGGMYELLLALQNLRYCFSTVFAGPSSRRSYAQAASNTTDALQSRQPKYTRLRLTTIDIMTSALATNSKDPARDSEETGKRIRRAALKKSNQDGSSQAGTKADRRPPYQTFLKLRLFLI